MTVKEVFGHVLRELRAARGLSQEALAEASSCHVNQVSFLERGVNGPSLDLVFRLASALGISPSEFIARVEMQMQQSEARSDEE